MKIEGVDPRSFWEAVKKDRIEPCYLFAGPEDFLMEQALAEIVKAVLPGKQKELNYQVFYGDECSTEDVLTAAMTGPFLAKKRVVALRRMEKMAAKEQVSFTSYVEDPSPYSVLVLLYRFDLKRVNGEKAPPKELTQAFVRPGTLVRFDTPSERKIPGWARHIAREEKKDISQEAIALLRDALGPDLFRLKNEIAKAAAYSSDKGCIDASDVEACLSGIAPESVFALADAIGLKDSARAISILDDLLSRGEPHHHPLRILALITTHFRKIVQAKEMLEKGESQSAIESVLRVREKLLAGFLEQARRSSWPWLLGAFARFYQCDLSLKSSGIPARMQLERTINDMCLSKAIRKAG